MSIRFATRFSATVGLLYVTLPCAVRAEQCVTLEAVPKTASLTIRRGTLTSSRSPLIYCDVVPGTQYYLNVFSPDYENRSMKFSMSSDGREVELSGDRLPYVLRSMLIPGTGLIAAKHGTRGTWLLMLNAAAIYYAVGTYGDYDAARDQANQLAAAANLAPTVPEAEAFAEQATAMSLEADVLKSHTYGTVALAGWIYLGNVLETYLVAAPPTVRSVQGTSAVVEVPRRSASRAVWRSAFVPGLGQNYLGSHFKAFMFQGAFIGSAVWALEATLDYDRANNGYSIALLNLEDAQTVSEIETALREVGRTDDQRRDKDAIRDVAIVVTGAVWALNVIDAAFSRKTEPSGNVGVGTSYRQSTFRTELNIKF